jgi:hypothetical protein
VREKRMVRGSLKTTILVKKTVRQKLDSLKYSKNESYDQVINEILDAIELMRREKENQEGIKK